MLKSVVFFLLSVNLIAGTSTVRAADNAKITQIKKLLELTEIATITQQAANATMLQLAREDNEKSGKSFPDTVLQEVTSIAVDILAEKMGKPGGLIDSFVTIYDKYYSSSEIQQMLSFYQSDIGRKMLSIAPRIVSETMTLTQTWFQRNADEFSTDFARRLEEKGIRLPGLQ